MTAGPAAKSARILFAWDAAAFGGHDVTALVALERLAGIPELTIGALHTGRNDRLADALDRLARKTGRIEIVRAAAKACVSESIDGLLRGSRTRSLEEAIVRWRPDWVVDVQGFITLGLCVLGACRAARIPVVSYLPMTHRIWTLRPSPVSWLQDAVNRFWYSVPRAFIVTSDRMKRKLVDEHGVPAERVAVAEYGPDLAGLSPARRSAAREKFGFSAEPVVGTLGRMEFRQKGQDFLIRAVARHREELSGYRFALAGDGPDLPAANNLIAQFGIGNLIQCLPWQDDPSDLYSALDVLLIPSRYEGMPLVMLEAMARRLPVLASDVDGMADVLPPECLFRSGDAQDMADRLRGLRATATPETLERLAGLIETRFNAQTFADRFAGEILRLAESDGAPSP